MWRSNERSFERDVIIWSLRDTDVLAKNSAASSTTYDAKTSAPSDGVADNDRSGEVVGRVELLKPGDVH